MIGVPLEMIADVGRALDRHGIKSVHQDHMNRLLILLGEMLAAQQEGGAA